MDGFEFEYDGYEGGVETATDAEVDFPDFVQQLLGDPNTEYEYDLIGADPDEDGIWDHLMLDGDVNPYVTN
jgi:hypothetical protein